MFSFRISVFLLGLVVSMLPGGIDVLYGAEKRPFEDNADQETARKRLARCVDDCIGFLMQQPEVQQQLPELMQFQEHLICGHKEQVLCSLRRYPEFARIPMLATGMSPLAFLIQRYAPGDAILAAILLGYGAYITRDAWDELVMLELLDPCAYATMISICGLDCNLQRRPSQAIFAWKHPLDVRRLETLAPAVD